MHIHTHMHAKNQWRTGQYAVAHGILWFQWGPMLGRKELFIRQAQIIHILNMRQLKTIPIPFCAARSRAGLHEMLIDCAIIIGGLTYY